jgi:hypothetical protein
MTVRRLFVFIFALSLFTLVVRVTIDTDMWWHLGTGEWILERGIPHGDVFSFTVPGREWITHEWLTQIIMALLWRAGGFPALILVFAAIMTSAFLLVYKSCVARPYLAAFIVLLGLLASKPITGARPQTFNWLFLAVWLYIIEGVKDGRFQRRVFFLFPILTVIWVNMHGGYLIGLVVLATYTAGEVLQMRFGPRDNRTLGAKDVQWLVGVIALCFVVSAINPNGYRMWSYPFETLGQEFSQSYVNEWQPPSFYTIDSWPFGILLALGIASLALSRRRPTWTEVLLFVGTGMAALTAVRHIPIFALVMVPITVRHASSILDAEGSHPLVSGMPPQYDLTRVRRIAHVSIATLLLLLAVARIVDVVRLNDAAIASLFPVDAVDFLEREGWVGTRRGYNHFDWGGYLIWRGVPVFIDGRPDMYGDEFMLMYMQTLAVTPEWRDPLNTYAVDYVLTKSEGSLRILLTESDDWQEVYDDGVACVFDRVQGSTEKNGSTQVRAMVARFTPS